MSFYFGFANQERNETTLSVWGSSVNENSGRGGRRGRSGSRGWYHDALFLAVLFRQEVVLRPLTAAENEAVACVAGCVVRKAGEPGLTRSDDHVLLAGCWWWGICGCLCSSSRLLSPADRQQAGHQDDCNDDPHVFGIFVGVFASLSPSKWQWGESDGMREHVCQRM